MVGVWFFFFCFFLWLGWVWGVVCGLWGVWGGGGGGVVVGGGFFFFMSLFGVFGCCFVVGFVLVGGP
ncbi:hypothetical protein, partial [Stenotrophomonas maltophilia]|uniref:hypothetical protein n=1 Tax=Stenotrophomonas maltophilia TaxID=40324 RepID=UPI0034533CD3